jgi:hypothetical protein
MYYDPPNLRQKRESLQKAHFSGIIEAFNGLLNGPISGPRQPCRCDDPITIIVRLRKISLKILR